MDRQQVIAKIKAMLALQEGTDFEGEAAAAASLIDKLCKQHGIALDDLQKVEVLDEVIESGLKISVAHGVLLSAVATFYDAGVYKEVYRRGQKNLRVIGSEAQQIQTRLYYDFLLEVMENECDKAHKAELILAGITGRKVDKSFKPNFRKAFAVMVSKRLSEMKAAENRMHPDAKAAGDALAKQKFHKGNKSYIKGDGAHAGYSAGSTASLHKQQTGGGNLALCPA